MKNTKYVSDATKFLNKLLKKPGNYEKQIELRHTWWDKDFIDLEEQKAYDKAEVKHDAYPYFTYKADKE